MVAFQPRLLFPSGPAALALWLLRRGRENRRKEGDTGLCDWGLRAAQAKTEMCKVPCRSSSSTHMCGHTRAHTRTHMRTPHASSLHLVSRNILVRSEGLRFGTSCQESWSKTCLHSPDLQSGVFGESSRTKFSPPSPSSPESQVLEAVPP